jgi:hypothetical protein
MNAPKHFIRPRIYPRSVAEEARSVIALSYLNNPEVSVAELQAILHNKHEIRLTKVAVGYLLRQFTDNVRFLTAAGLLNQSIPGIDGAPPFFPSRNVSEEREEREERIVRAQRPAAVTSNRVSTPRRALLHTLMEASRPLAPMEIVAATGMRNDAVRLLLHRMVRDRPVVRTTHGRYRPAPAERPGRGHSRAPGPGRWGHE